MLVLRLEEDSDSVVKKCAVEDGGVKWRCVVNFWWRQALGSLGAFSKHPDCIGLAMPFCDDAVQLSEGVDTNGTARCC